jgi:hypothetical protein
MNYFVGGDSSRRCSGSYALRGSRLVPALCVGAGDAERPGQCVPTQSVGTREIVGQVGNLSRVGATSGQVGNLSYSSPHLSPLPRGEGTDPARRGAILVVIIVCFVVAATLFVLLARSAVADRRAAETRYWSVQAQWLAEAALERAAARLATDAKYDGETWTVPAEQFGGDRGGVVTIGLDSSDTDHPGRRLVRVEARYPDDPVHCCQWEKQVVMERRGMGEKP